MPCNNCGEDMIGDGNSTVKHCPRVEPDGCEPDADPIHCTKVIEVASILYGRRDKNGFTDIFVDVEGENTFLVIQQHCPDGGSVIVKLTPEHLEKVIDALNKAQELVK